MIIINLNSIIKSKHVNVIIIQYFFGLINIIKSKQALLLFIFFD